MLLPMRQTFVFIPTLKTAAKSHGAACRVELLNSFTKVTLLPSVTIEFDCLHCRPHTLYKRDNSIADMRGTTELNAISEALRRFGRSNFLTEASFSEARSVQHCTLRFLAPGWCSFSIGCSSRRWSNALWCRRTQSCSLKEHNNQTMSSFVRHCGCFGAGCLPRFSASGAIIQISIESGGAM